MPRLVRPPHHPATAWRFAAGRSLALEHPRVLGILNLTPDSFSDGGALTSPDDAARAALDAVRAGAAGLDVGGESTRPGAERVPARAQVERVVPALRAVRAAIGPEPVITIDTTRAAVAHAALEAGADAINDVSAGTEDPAMLPLAAERGCGIILMHRLRPPPADVYSHEHAQPPAYEDVVRDVAAFLAARAAAAIAAGVSDQAIVLDPGLGFGKSVDQNLSLIRRTDELVRLGFPILSALSRKSFVGVASGLPRTSRPADRHAGTIALTLAHWCAGASLFRVHEVGPAVEALRAVDAAFASP